MDLTGTPLPIELKCPPLTVVRSSARQPRYL